MQAFHTVTDPQLVELLLSGAVGIMPTDTIYGIVCSARDKQAVRRLYELKSREHKPGTVIAASVEQLVALGIDRDNLDTVKRFWPGAVSVETRHDLAYLHQGTGRQAFRVPADPALHKLLTKTGPLLTSSANLPGEPPATTVLEAKQYFADRVDFYLDGGTIADRLPSTIIRLNEHRHIEVIREGAAHITLKEEAK